MPLASTFGVTGSRSNALLQLPAQVAALFLLARGRLLRVGVENKRRLRAEVDSVDTPAVRGLTHDEADRDIAPALHGHERELGVLWDVLAGVPFQENVETLYGAVDDGALKLALRPRTAPCAPTAAKQPSAARSLRGSRPSRSSSYPDTMSKIRGPYWVASSIGVRREAARRGRPEIRRCGACILQAEACPGGRRLGQSGAVLVVKRTSSDLRLNPHVHAVFVDGAFHEDAPGEVKFAAQPRLPTEQVACMLEDATRRIARYLRRAGLLDEDGAVLAAPEGDEAALLALLAASAASGVTPPAGPSLCRGALPACTTATSIVTCRSARWVHAARGDARGRDGRARARGASEVRAAPADRAGAGHARSREARAHRPEEALLGWDVCGGPRSALAPHAPVRVGTAASLPYRTVRRSARVGEQAPSPHPARASRRPRRYAASKRRGRAGWGPVGAAIGRGPSLMNADVPR